MRQYYKKGKTVEKKKSFPDMSGDGKITKKDILIAKGVIPGKRKTAMGGGMMRKTFNKGGGADRPGLYANIKAKKDRIKAGSGEKMRKVGAKGAPTAQNFKDAAKTAKKV